MTGPQTSSERPDRAGAAAAVAIESPDCPPGSQFPLLPGVRSRMVPTPRLLQHVYESGPADGERLLLIHGNASSARFFEDLMITLPAYHIVAPDQRGYGATELKRVDASRGMRDYADDIEALVQTLGWECFHMLGWSLGGCIVMQYVLDHPQRVRTLTLHATGSPFGYGGTRNAVGEPTYDDFAGSGGGLIGAQVVERYLAKDFTADSPFAPRSGLRNLIVKPTCHLPPGREDALTEQMLLMAIGDEDYPGDKGPASPNWPYSTPGAYGSNNALSPKYCDLSGLGDLHGGPPILWIRGADDLMVSNAAAADPANLGRLGMIPGWPGEEACPPQPMLAQIRGVLDRYAANGGTYQEVVLDDCGHSPLLEKPAEFRERFVAFIATGAADPALPSSVRGGESSAHSAANPGPSASQEVTSSPATAHPGQSAPPVAGEGVGGGVSPKRRGLLAKLLRRR